MNIKSKKKLQPAVQPVSSLRSVAVAILNHHFKSMWDYYDLIADRENEEVINDMRVASRRLRAALTDFRYRFDKKDYKLLFSPTRQLTRILGRARDFEVLFNLMKITAAQSLPGLNNPYEIQMEHCQGLVRQSRDELIVFIQELNNSHYPATFKKILRRLESSIDDPSGSGKSFVYHMYYTLPTHVDAFYKISETIKKPKPWGPLHKMRIAAKRLRYSLELYKPCFDDDYERIMETIKIVQEKLGNIQDRVMIIGYLKKFYKIRPKPDTSTAVTLPPDPIPEMIKTLTKDRNALHADFSMFWEQMQREAFKPKIETMIRQSFLKHIRHTRDLNVMEQLFIDVL